MKDPIDAAANYNESISSSIISVRSSQIGFTTIIEEEDDDYSSEHASIFDEIVDRSEIPRPQKRTSFAPDPVHYSQARQGMERWSSGRGISQHMAGPSTDEGGGKVSIFRMFTSIFTSTSLASDLHASGIHPSFRRDGWPRATIFTRGSTTMSMDYSTDGDTNTCDGRTAREKSCLSDTCYDVLKRILEHRLWKFVSILVIFTMLFGSQIHEIWFPKSWDVTGDILFFLAFLLSSIDIIFRSLVDPKYFQWTCDSKILPHQTREVRVSSSKPCERCTNCNFHVGSFMFWCDTIATLTFLYEIEFINPLFRVRDYHDLFLNRFGVPVKRQNLENHIGLEKPELELIVIVGRVTRMARFIRATVVLEIANNLECLQYLYPLYWKRVFTRIKYFLFHCRKKGCDCDSFRKEQKRSTRQSHVASAQAYDDTVQNSNAGTTGFVSGPTNTSIKGGKVQHLHAGNSSSKVVGSTMRRSRRKISAGSLFKDSSSHVGAEMRELTGQRVAVGVILAVLLNVIFRYEVRDSTREMAMITLHGQTGRPLEYADAAINIAHSSVVPTLYRYERRNKTGLVFTQEYSLNDGFSVENLREREILEVTVYSDVANTTGLFDNRRPVKDEAMLELITTLFLLIFWIIGVTALAGPVMILVVEPIERMVVLLALLMKDPLGYQNTPQYQEVTNDDDEIYEFSLWKKDVLKGMETSFLMSTISRIGSLMQVGFGSAGTEIIRNGLERGRHKDVLFLNKKGSTVSCIFLFCDIRSFTDATECLQEEVFVFTNKIAAVVHSICHAYGGSANKNIGDAFLVSWLLDETTSQEIDDEIDHNLNCLYAHNNQADKALLSVVKISLALYYDSYFVESMNEDAKTRLLAKFSKRPGPLVQMGFGLHAGKAVQGAIGSTRKLDATYISESVEYAEFLESSTKKYGVPVLMSDAFFNLLEPATKHRCRKVDQIVLLNEEDNLLDFRERLETGEKMELFTFDMDIAALWRHAEGEDESTTSHQSELNSSATSRKSRPTLTRVPSTRRVLAHRDLHTHRNSFNFETGNEDILDKQANKKELVLPVGRIEYSDRSWLDQDIKSVRRAYVSNGLFFPKFDDGLKSYYAKDWGHAKTCFETVLAQVEDGPSRYFLKCMEEYDGIPPRDFIGYGME